MRIAVVMQTTVVIWIAAAMQVAAVDTSYGRMAVVRATVALRLMAQGDPGWHVSPGWMDGFAGGCIFMWRMASRMSYVYQALMS